MRGHLVFSPGEVSQGTCVVCGAGWACYGDDHAEEVADHLLAAGWQEREGEWYCPEHKGGKADG